MKKKQLFCVPYAGGTAKFYNGIVDRLKDDFEIFVFEFPGHGTRTGEKLNADINELVLDFKDFFEQHRNKEMDFVIFGYSMGSLVVYEFLKLIDEIPTHVFMAAHEPPCIPFRGKHFPTLSDDEFVDEMIKLGGVDERLLVNRKYLPFFFKPVKNDYRLMAEYVWNEQYDKIKCGVTMFYSPDDTGTNEINQWVKFVDGKFETKMYGGNHFFLKENEDEIAGYIRNYK